MSTVLDLDALNPAAPLHGNQAQPTISTAEAGAPPDAEEELILTSRKKITLQCGQSSITLHPNGKIVLRGEYILSVAEGTNRIIGGQIELN